MTGPQPVLSPIDAFGALHSQLKRAMLASTDRAATETMRQADMAAVDAITALNQEGFRARTAEFKDLSVSVNKHLTALTALKDSLDSIVADVTLAAKVASAIDSAVSAAAQVFPLPAA